MTEDKIRWAIAKHDEHGEFPGRYELGLKNLTRAEAVQLLATLDKLQRDRRTIGYAAGTLDISAASEPSTAAADFFNSTSGAPGDDIYSEMAAAMAKSTRLGSEEIRRAGMSEHLAAPYGEPA